MTMKITPLTSIIAAEVSGLDLAKPLDRETASALRQALLDHLVLIFRGQDLSEPEQVRFAEYFGTPMEIRQNDKLKRRPDADPRVMQEFSRPTYGDARDWWRDWRDPVDERFTRATGWDWSEFIATWDRRLRELRSAPHYRRELEAIAKSELIIAPEIAARGTRSLRYTLRLDRPLPDNTRCLALHTRLPSFDRPVGRSMLREAEVFWPESTDHAPALSIDFLLTGEYGSGTRVFAALECQFPQFRGPLYLGSIRLTMP